MSTLSRGRSRKKNIDIKYKKMGDIEAMTGALILFVLGSPKKKKVMLMVTPKNPPRHMSANCRKVSGDQCFTINKRYIVPAKKKRIKARVKGGMFSSENLKIGDAAPQIMFAMTSAQKGFIL